MASEPLDEQTDDEWQRRIDALYPEPTIGDIFTFTADTNSFQYALTAVVSISATVQKVLTFYPPLKTAPLTGATLIFVSVPYTVNLAFHPGAMAFARSVTHCSPGVSGMSGTSTLRRFSSR